MRRSLIRVSALSFWLVHAVCQRARFPRTQLRSVQSAPFDWLFAGWHYAAYNYYQLVRICLC